MKLRILAAEPDENGIKKPAGVKFLALPSKGRQNIQRSTLEQLNEFVTISKGQIIFHSEDGDVKFNIIHAPGRYCLTCGTRLADKAANGSDDEAAAAKACRDHVATHDDPVVTDRWPAGYSVNANHYVCEVVSSKLTEGLQNG